MSYITKYSTTAAYNLVKDSLNTPHVALTADNMVVHYHPYVSSVIDE